METERSNVIVIAGPNGAGKSTISRKLLAGTLGVHHFVNADTLARGLSEFHPEMMAIKAGKIMLEHLHELAAAKANFAFETTLATRGFAPWIKTLKEQGYLFHLFYVWLPSADAAIERVARRVESGGHHVPDETVRRRYTRSLDNFFKLYQPLTDRWQFFNNSNPLAPILVAEGRGTMERVAEPGLWQTIRERTGQ
jgi:predicted ABC-type ATPase